jgi:glutathione peroxidase-family protein
MLRHCRKSCQASLHSLTPSLPTDFYSITERDIYGNLVHYSQFRNKLVYVVNVASQCGYTAENYKLLQSLSELRSDATSSDATSSDATSSDATSSDATSSDSSGTSMFEILVFPCNQFGAQEPGTADEIAYFAQQFGFDGRVMAKGDVNGRSAGATFQYLKSVTGRQKIAWWVTGTCTHSLIHSLTNSLIHSLTHELTNSVTNSLTHSIASTMYIISIVSSTMLTYITVHITHSLTYALL